MFSNFKFKNMNTTLTSTLSTTLVPTLEPDDTYVDIYIILFIFVCPVLCFIGVICFHNGNYSFKRRGWRVTQTSSSKDELSRINNEYYDGV